MAAINSKMSVKRWVFAGIVIITVSLLIVYVAFDQGRTETMKSRLVYHTVIDHIIEVGDTTGHVLGIGEHRGLMFLETGEVGTYSGWVMYDEKNGKGTHYAYGLTTYNDGSSHLTKSNGTSPATQGSDISSFKGTFTLIAGSGRFKGIKGSGSYTGKNVCEAGLYCDVTKTYTLP